MAKTQIIWTVLPYGTTGNQQRVSVVASPRLTPERLTEQVLRAFPEFLEWPDIINGAAFSAEIEGRIIPLRLVSTVDRDIWYKLFSKETFVEGFQYKDMSKLRLRSYSIRNILRYLKKHYAKLAVESPSELPKLLPWDEAQPDLKDMLEEAWPKKPDGFDFIRFFDKNFNESNEKSAPGNGIEDDLYRADRFYRRVRPTEAEMNMRRPNFENIPAPPDPPEYDFHQIIASLADYPELMRRLGLVLDFVLTERVTTQSGKLRLRISWRNQHDPDVDATPWTAFLADGERFSTRPRTSDQKEGLLNLGNSNDSYNGSSGLFDVYQVDPDGAALKTVDFTINAQNLIRKHYPSVNNKHGEITFTTGDRQGLAALRSGGLGISRHGRADDVKNDIETMDNNNDALDHYGGDFTLFAEDVFRGYRVDVADVTDEQRPAVWRTLCARVGDYSLTKSGEKIYLKPDEGYVYGASTTSEKPDSDEQYLHESLFRWTGWSLCTPRPGLTLMAEEADDGNIQSEVLCEITDEAENGCGVKSKFTTPRGSLPRLRYGNRYRLRARIVDLAGNSLAIDDPSLRELTGASDAVGYWRFEPIDPPVLAHRARLSEGESLERMVIRSNYDASAEEYIRTKDFIRSVSLPDSRDFGYGSANERHFVPPKSSQLQCETHGLFDAYFGDWERIKTAYEIAADREAGSLYDGLPDSPDPEAVRDCPVKLITPSSLKDIATTMAVKPNMPSPENPVGDRMAGGQYVIHGEAQIETPWLPDGAAGGTAIRAAADHELPGVKGETNLGNSCVIRKINNKFVVLVSNEGEWPNSNGFRLILAERNANIDSSLYLEEFADDGAPIWNENERTLTFFVPKGRIVRLVYSSFAKEAFIDSFGIPRWVQDDARRESVCATARHGANWLITPFRELTLVHATQAPVFEPRFNNLRLERKIGSHDARLIAESKSNDEISLHGPSTGKFEVEAKWREWVDDIAKPAPERVEFKGQLGEIKLAENHPNEFNLIDAVKAQQLDPYDPDDPNVQRGDIHALGDTRFRLIKYQIRATTRFREYLPPSIYADPELVTRLGPVAVGYGMLLPPEDDPGAPILGYMTDTTGMTLSDQQSCVPASAPPEDPRVLYVVPTMRRHSNEQADGHDVTRYGNGLRVWLDRPWFSSGDGELLGVVILRDGDGLFDKIQLAFQPLVTQWGLDPFWVSSLSKPQAMAADFTARVTQEVLKLQENPAANVEIVGHRVHWDDDRRLWYCDIELDPLTTYMPFVRLALVRYQPNALQNQKISKVFLTEFTQVLPRRRATVKVDGSKITATLRGPHPSSGPMGRSEDSPPKLSNVLPMETGSNRVELVLQTRPLLVNSDLAWEDSTILVNQVVGAETKVAANLLKADVVEPAKDVFIKVETRAGSVAQLSPIVDLGKLRALQPDIGKAVPLAPPVLEIGENPFWEAAVTLPATGNANPRRLMLREFERFYKNASTSVIEERLVFADIIPL